jgi:hypothetical protein
MANIEYVRKQSNALRRSSCQRKKESSSTYPIHFYSTLNLVIPCSASNAQIANVARRFAGPGQPARPIGNGEQFQASVLGQQGL